MGRKYLAWARNRKWRVCGSFFAIPISSTLLEYIISTGESGWPPTIAAILVGIMASAFTLVALEKISPPSTREFSPRTSVELVSEVAGQTALVSQAIIARHKGKWLSASGEIREIVDHGASFVLVILSTHYDDNPGYWLRFDSKVWRNKLESHNIGDTIRAVGKIRDVDWTGIHLDDCELFGP